MGLIEINISLSHNRGNWNVSDGLVFDIEDVRKLRELGICGVLAGSLPTLPQQNVFLSVPLRLMAEETLWLVQSGYGKLNVTNSTSLQTLLRSGNTEREVLNKSLERTHRSFELQRVYKCEEQRKKIEKYGLSKKVEPEGLQSSMFQEIWNDSLVLRHKENDQKRALDILMEHHGDKLATFSHLKELGFVVSPGARFGGKYIIYPGDPLRFHSHLIVSPPLDYFDDSIDFSNMIDGARLATSVKKIWVLNGRKEDEPQFFSIEWAGFG